MKRISLNLSRRQWIFLFSSLVCALLALGLYGVSSLLKNNLMHEQTANLWDAEGDTAHISVYLSETEKYNMKDSLDGTVFQLNSRYHGLLTELESAVIGTEDGKPSRGRQVVYGYSAAGTITMKTSRASAEVKAYGVGGDFFQFHPLELKNGAYFSESDLMQDKVLLDTDTAWKLFGSNDIVGMFVEIGGIPHLVAGVYERDSGYFNDAAGNDLSCVYVSHATLYKLGHYHGLETVEYLLPNPVTGFGLDLVQKQYDGMDVAIVEHQERFEFVPLLKILGAFGTRSMGLTGITFPYWENIARGYEDILAYLLLTQLLLLAYTVVVMISILWSMWMRRAWRVHHIYEWAKDGWYAFGVSRHEHKLNRRHKEHDNEAADDLHIDTDF